MKVNIENNVRRTADIGDLIVCEKGNFLIVRDETNHPFTYMAIDLDTFEKVNGFKELIHIGLHNNDVCNGSGQILEIVKSSELELRRG
jgi:hypothetical protein